jgi:HPt (histidine-containing phosphotransfer) domain-containing protein
MSPRKNAAAPPVKVQRGLDHEVIHPVNLLRKRAVVMHDGPHVLDETAIRRAEQALKALAPEFNGWMEDAVRKLLDAWAAIGKNGLGEGRLGALHRDAHDIKGQATTLGFPLASRVGASLCLIIEGTPRERLSDKAVMLLMGQHVDAIRAITREGISKAAHPVGDKLAAELELVAEHMVAAMNGAKLH